MGDEFCLSFDVVMVLVVAVAVVMDDEEEAEHPTVTSARLRRIRTGMEMTRVVLRFCDRTGCIIR